MNALDYRKQIQALLHVAEDGVFGPKTLAAMNLLRTQSDGAPWPPLQSVQPDDSGVHAVKASSFADPVDVRMFRACKAMGRGDTFCFGVGDNGVGKWGDDCTGEPPMCALPPEYWARYGAAARGKKVGVLINGLTVICELRDTMPHESLIKNGAGIDLSPAAVAAFNLHPPIMVPAQWWWVEEQKAEVAA